MGWTVVPTTANFAKQKITVSPPPIQEAGYVFVYLSYENAGTTYVNFDDIKVTHTKNNIVQYNEYYAYGHIAQTSWIRENVTGNNFLFNGGTELNVTTGVYDLYYRNYDPVLGRMNQIDPVASKYSSLSPYNFALNDPALFNDPMGDDVVMVSDRLYNFVMTFFNRSTGGPKRSHGQGSTPIKDNGTFGGGGGVDKGGVWTPKDGWRPFETDLEALNAATSLIVDQILNQDKSLKDKLDEIEKRYRTMIDRARAIGWNVAAANLEYFLAGVGGVRDISRDWLMSFNVAQDGVERIKMYFESQTFVKAALNLREGKRITISDFWVADIYANPMTELYYASGASKITGNGTFTLLRTGNVVSIKGSVSFSWNDDYDWHLGLFAEVPGFGTVSDEDGLLMQEHRGAKTFQMRSMWTSSVIGFISPSSKSFKWTDY